MTDPVTGLSGLGSPRTTTLRALSAAYREVLEMEGIAAGQMGAFVASWTAGENLGDLESNIVVPDYYGTGRN